MWVKGKLIIGNITHPIKNKLIIEFNPNAEGASIITNVLVDTGE